jgi:hypothetical protein
MQRRSRTFKPRQHERYPLLTRPPVVNHGHAYHSHEVVTILKDAEVLLRRVHVSLVPLRLAPDVQPLDLCLRVTERGEDRLSPDDAPACRSSGGVRLFRSMTGARDGIPSSSVGALRLNWLAIGLGIDHLRSHGRASCPQQSGSLVPPKMLTTPSCRTPDATPTLPPIVTVLRSRHSHDLFRSKSELPSLGRIRWCGERRPCSSAILPVALQTRATSVPS